MEDASFIDDHSNIESNQPSSEGKKSSYIVTNVFKLIFKWMYMYIHLEARFCIVKLIDLLINV